MSTFKLKKKGEGVLLFQKKKGKRHTAEHKPAKFASKRDVRTRRNHRAEVCNSSRDPLVLYHVHEGDVLCHVFSD